MVGHVNRKPHVFEFGVETEEKSPGPALGVVQGEIHGTAVIRGPDGTIKGEISFGGPTTLSVDEVREAMGLNQEKQEEVIPNGGDSNDGSS